MPIIICGRVQETASGHGLPNVAVSNGEIIVRTDANGCYTLPVEHNGHRFVFVTMPDGYCPDQTFFRSTEIWDTSQDGIDFDVVPAPTRAQKVFTFAQITDTHVVINRGGLTLGERLGHELQRLVETATPAFILASGDLTNRGTIPELHSYFQAIQSANVPVFSMFGGHDGNAERYAGESGMTFTHNYEAVLGPTYYSFDWGGKHFVLYPNEDGFFSPTDRQRKEKWLWTDLSEQAEGVEIILVVHTPPGVKFLDRLACYNVRLVLHGHWHSSKVSTYGDITVAATPPFCFGGIDTSPRGYRQITCRENQTRMTLCESAPALNPSSSVRESGAANTKHNCGQELAPTFDEPSEIRLSADGTEGDTKSLRLRWRRQLDTGFHRASLIRVGTDLLVSMNDENARGRQGVLCLEARTGDTRWHAPTSASVKNSVAVTDAICVCVSITGRVYAIEMESGAALWQAELPGYPERWVYTSPVIGDGTVYVGAKSGYAAYALKTGERRWYAELERSDAWACYASPQIYQDLVVVLISRRGLLALNRETGETVWEQELAVEYQYPSPVGYDGLLISGGDKEHLVVLKACSGEVVWHKPVLEANYASGLTVDAEKIYATTPEGELRCHRLDTGELQWKFRMGWDLLDMTPYRYASRSALAQPVLFGNQVIGCGIDGELYVINDSGECISRTAFGSPISATPCVVADGIYVGTYDGRLYCFSLGSHQPRF